MNHSNKLEHRNEHQPVPDTVHGSSNGSPCRVGKQLPTNFEESVARTGSSPAIQVNGGIAK
jgi:hypothetical protein